MWAKQYQGLDGVETFEPSRHRNVFYPWFPKTTKDEHARGSLADKVGLLRYPSLKISAPSALPSD
ncbi:hypothetical protein JMJ77_0013900 [Colletotrichum scovillei]|uniref:Uncharacterized protein n=1 Tax=Colletotrichum scovillei TaxID=1209932 RepID=A0A9P7R5M2_9PEZI|nr:hypothetical protein JMJ77_0013900 [Colletotrichum scovillei]KAG7065422.1 hypothetical protein JMJ78_0012176 [Colletotrichum scovillei]KAG7068024.1 hypothetical protein JMJ76_0007721 [Colletotrichum scovillei]